MKAWLINRHWSTPCKEGYSASVRMEEGQTFSTSGPNRLKTFLEKKSPIIAHKNIYDCIKENYKEEIVSIEALKSTENENGNIVLEEFKILQKSIKFTQVFIYFSHWCSFQMLKYWDAPDIIVDYIKVNREVDGYRAYTELHNLLEIETDELQRAILKVLLYSHLYKESLQFVSNENDKTVRKELCVIDEMVDNLELVIKLSPKKILSKQDCIDKMEELAEFVL